MICVSGQSKSRPVKAAGAEVGAARRNQKLHAVVAKSTFGSENVKKLTVSEHFLKFWCPKTGRRCGENHMWKWKCTKHEVFGTLFDVLMSKNCTPLWRNVNVDVKMLKSWRHRSTFWSSDVENMHAAVAKSKCGNENVQNMRCLEHFLKFRCRKNARRCGETQIWKWKCTKHVVFGALLEVLMSKNQSVSKFVSQSMSPVVNQSVTQLVR